MQIWNTISGI